jgi:hypothetical protein
MLLSRIANLGIGHSMIKVSNLVLKVVVLYEL